MNKGIKKLAESKADKDKDKKGRVVPLDYVDPAVGPRGGGSFSDFSGKNTIYTPAKSGEVLGTEGPIRGARTYEGGGKLSKKVTFYRSPSQRYDTMYRGRR
jgi:hypothetical protein